MLAAGLVQLAARFPVLERLIEELPELDPGEEIRLLVVELLLRLVGCGGALARPLPADVDLERGGYPHHLADPVLLFCPEDHPAGAGVDRQSSSLLSD